MDKITHYQKILLNLLAEYERPNGRVERLVLTDLKRHHYQIVEAGWADSNRYYYGVLFHFYLKNDGKIYVLENNTEDDLEEILIDKGVSNFDIVLNFVPERLRQTAALALD